MDPQHFDAISRRFAGRRLSRRQAIVQASSGLAAGALATAGLKTAAAQDATPAATPVAGGTKGEHDPTFLFVQSFQSGALAPAAGSSDTFTLTLEQGLGQTIYFSDRPERIVGTTKTGTFLERFPFGADNPPNAALVVETGADDTDVVVLELTSPAYDEATKTATFAAKVLADYQELGTTFQEEPKGADDVPATFGAASLFIDDCPDATVTCMDSIDPSIVIGNFTIGTCWSSSQVCCQYCCASTECSFDQMCDDHFGSRCHSQGPGIGCKFSISEVEFGC